MPSRPESDVGNGARAVIRCPGCGAKVSALVRAGAVRALDMIHEDHCAWLQAVERGVPVTPPRVAFLRKGRS